MTAIYTTVGAVVVHAAWIIPTAIIIVLAANGILNTASKLIFFGVAFYRHSYDRDKGLTWFKFARFAVSYFFSIQFLDSCFIGLDGETRRIYGKNGSWEAWNRWQVYLKNDDNVKNQQQTGE